MGQLEDKGVMKLKATKNPADRSYMIDYAHKLVKSDKGEVYVL